MIGYFMPPTSGNYTFLITGVDVQVLIRVGDGVALYCSDHTTGGAEQESVYSSG